ncbi:MAG: hypothetical protein H2045_11630 [Rhizobiales bacterium]|nr:hypothetical protein [Hyphomicrobiales bacterium]
MSIVKTPVARSVLSHRTALAGQGIALREKPHLPKCILRGTMKKLDKLTKTVCELAAPKAGKTNANRAGALHWIGPDSLLFVGDDVAAMTKVEALTAHAAHDFAHARAVSNNYTVIECSGPKARDALQKLASLDLHPSVFRTADVAGTVFGHANVVLAARGEAVFDIIIRRSHADYMWCLIANAGYEFGLPKELPVSGEILRA